MVMRRNSIYVTLIIVSAFAGEWVRIPSPSRSTSILIRAPFATISPGLGFCFYPRFWVGFDKKTDLLELILVQAVDYGVHKLWKHNNVGIMHLNFISFHTVQGFFPSMGVKFAIFLSGSRFSL